MSQDASSNEIGQVGAEGLVFERIANC